MALTANREVQRYVDQELRSYAVKASTHVYKGAFVGLTGGYARGLVAGDSFVGIAYEEMDNSAGADGAKSVRLFTLGDFQLPLAGATIANLGAALYASDDQTLTLTAGGNSFVGMVVGFVSSGLIVARLIPSHAATVRGMGVVIEHHTTDDALTAAESGSVHTNLGAAGTVTFTLPQTGVSAGTAFTFACMADQALRVDPGAAGAVYIKGVKQADDKYVQISDIGDFMTLVADGNGDWVSTSNLGGVETDIVIEP